jgi:hypothetical protein
MPTIPAGEQSQQNRVRYKNLLRAARIALTDKGVSRSDARQFLAPASDLFDRPQFTQRLGRGLAVLIGCEAIRVLSAPFEFEQQCVVGKRFHITPLIEWASAESPYYVLAVSQNRVRLFYGTRETLDEVVVPGLPANLSQALHYDEPEGSFQVHSGRPHLRRKESAVFHGQGGAPDAAKDEISSFFREVDRALDGVPGIKGHPLVFAGVNYLFPIFRRISSQPQLLSSHVDGNPDLTPLNELRERAWSVVRMSIEETRQSRIASYWDLATHSRTSNQIGTILVAAQAGAVKTLLLDPRIRRLGAFDLQAGTLRIDQQARHDNEDLVNLAATLVLRHGGAFEAMTTSHVPGGGVMAAILRYPFSSPSLVAAGEVHVNAAI